MQSIDGNILTRGKAFACINDFLIRIKRPWSPDFTGDGAWTSAGRLFQPLVLSEPSCTDNEALTQ